MPFSAIITSTSSSINAGAGAPSSIGDREYWGRVVARASTCEDDTEVDFGGISWHLLVPTDPRNDEAGVYQSVAQEFGGLVASTQPEGTASKHFDVVVARPSFKWAGIATGCGACIRKRGTDRSGPRTSSPDVFDNLGLGNEANDVPVLALGWKPKLREAEAEVTRRRQPVNASFARYAD
ncbi:hypothetical protein ARMGADRAFT_1064234 [Armillaria gallica]|uniref:Uncharacterized protein n=1 Tax=Armillaria gallica TaxID=47427 RepID=A0A2H3D7H6_ARMGA|nr:hypothetical protein ARMGADRAFT_1064234 [Armillaria gallica]